MLPRLYHQRYIVGDEFSAGGSVPWSDTFREAELAQYLIDPSLNHIYIMGDDLDVAGGRKQCLCLFGNRPDVSQPALKSIIKEVFELMDALAYFRNQFKWIFTRSFLELI